MAVDTRAKRFSMIDMENVWESGIPAPDGTIGQGDRQHFLWSYSGILWAVSAVIVLPITGTLTESIITGSLSESEVTGSLTESIVTGVLS